MKIRVIHAITGLSASWLEREEKILRSYAKPDTQFEIVSIQRGAASIESYFDIYIGSLNTLRLVKEAEEKGCDGVIITCFGNASLDPAREIVNIPVVGSGQASMLLAAGLGHRFSVIGTVRSAADRHRMEVMKLGLETKLASVRCIESRVLSLHDDLEATLNAMVVAGGKAIEEDGAQVLIPGCFGMIGLAENMQQKLGVPVVDPAGASVKLAETLVDLKLSQSKLAFPIPPPKKRDF
ncbi:MAG: aspartate/glutamate racemase family protein [Deltaproteobacteria bacterium]|nr:aspartate/glutamate racemase family protein [Deltaproteobacteria bacterium]MBW2306649.1 aspartate/glutamate racemase family protein [Deltaproteobacteria bacterium]